MVVKLLDPELIKARQIHIDRRGLNSWPQDDAADLVYIQRFRDILDSLEGELVLEHPTYDLKLPVQRGFSPRMAYYFSLGDYEQVDLRLLDEYLLPGDRVLECGGGAGVTGSLAGRCSSQLVTVIEPNNRLYGQIQHTFQANGQQVEIVPAALVPDDFPAGRLTIGLHEEYWWTSSQHPDRAESQLEVAVISLSAALDRYQPTVLVLDIEGGEQGLFPASLPDALRLIIIEIHTPDIGDQASAEIVNAIVAQGFAIKRILGQTWLFERTLAG